VIPTKSDSLPLVFSEAVQAGRPVVGTDVGDLGRFIRRYRVGVVTRANDLRGLFSAMLRMARGPVYSLAGSEELLARLDPNEAARIFCKTALRSRVGEGVKGNRPVPAIPAAAGKRQ
jgi:glycosyltransferase involved in cell wall biosynthesis